MANREPFEYLDEQLFGQRDGGARRVQSPRELCDVQACVVVLLLELLPASA